MTEAPQAKTTNHASRARVVWLLLFIVIASVLMGMIFWSSGASAHPSVRLPGGPTFTFAAITDSSVKSLPSPWWESGYQKIWMKSPRWLQRKLPAPPWNFAFNDVGFMNFGRYRFCIWLDSSCHEFSGMHWTVSVNGLPAAWQHNGGIPWGVTASSPGFLKMRTKGRLVLYVDALPPDTVPIITVKFTSKQTGDSALLEIPNPSYHPTGK